MEKDSIGKILGLQIHPKLIDDMNQIASILDIDADILVCDAIKMYLSAMKICTHRIMDCAEVRCLVNIDEDGNKSLSKFKG